MNQYTLNEMSSKPNPCDVFDLENMAKMDAPCTSIPNDTLKSPNAVANQEASREPALSSVPKELTPSIPWDEFLTNIDLFNGNFNNQIANETFIAKSTSEDLDTLAHKLSILGCEFEKYELEMIETKDSYCTRLQNVSSFLGGSIMSGPVEHNSSGCDQEHEQAINSKGDF